MVSYRPTKLTKVNEALPNRYYRDLFIQALVAIQDAPENDLLSWFQISGIHGLPFRPYNGVEQVPGGEDKSGYYPHGEITFIT